MPEVVFLESSGSHGGRAEPHSSWDNGALVLGHAVLVQSDHGLVADGLHSGAVNALRLLQVDEDEVVVGAARYNLVAELLHLVAQGLAIAHYLQLVLLELGRLGLLQGDGNTGNGVIVGAALQCGKDGAVDALLEVLHAGLVTAVQNET